MSARMIFAFVAAAGAGWVARGATLHSAVAAPVVAHNAPPSCPNPEAIAVAAAVMTPDPPTEQPTDSDATPDPDDESAGDDIGAILAKANAATISHNGIHGVVTDQTGGTPIRGVTIILVQPDAEGKTAVTEEDGAYAFADLAAGTYTVNFYYLNVVSEHQNITVSSFDSVSLSERFDTVAVYEQYREEYGEGEGLEDTSGEGE